jgi:hypothetical protein
MFLKNFKTRETEKLNDVKELVEKYSKDYYLSVDFYDNGKISVFVGADKKKVTEQQ